jgi:hypothetical protein
MFVTSDAKAPQDFGGLDGADKWCMDAATAGHLPPATYVAWLSTNMTPSAMDAVSRLQNSRGWVRPDGRPFADGVSDLMRGAVFYPPRVDETGHDLADTNAAVATATDADGARNGFTCRDYTVFINEPPNIGRAYSTTEKWTHVGNSSTCNTPVHIYCFGLGRQVAVSPPPNPGLRAFVSQASFAVQIMGVQAADAICNHEAINRGFPPKFTALLATMGQSALQRVGPGPWYRLDGAEIGDLTGLPMAPINCTTIMDYTFDTVWTGASNPSEIGTAASTCSDWTSSTSASGAFGNASATNDSFFDSGQDLCTQARRLYCMEHL